MAVNSVFQGAANKVAGTFSTNNGGMSAKDVPLGLVTNVSINYSQTVNRIFDMNLDFRGGKDGAEKSAMYYVGGRAQGGVSIGRVLGPKDGNADYCAFYKEYGNICGIKQSILFTFRGDKAVRGAAGAGKCEKEDMKFTVIDPLLTTIGITQNANDVIINENVNLMFADLLCG